MSKFYMRVFKDGKRERTVGASSRYDNAQNYMEYMSILFNASTRYRKNPNNYSGPVLGTKYRFELVRNRHDEKIMYREIEFELTIPPIDSFMDVQIIVCKDITYIDTDPRVLKLPDNY